MERRRDIEDSGSRHGCCCCCCSSCCFSLCSAPMEMLPRGSGGLVGVDEDEDSESELARDPSASLARSFFLALYSGFEQNSLTESLLVRL